MKNKSSEAGEVNPLLIGCVVLGVFVVGFAGFGVWAFANYLDQKNNTDAKIASAVSIAEEKQKDELEKDFNIRYENPHDIFNGPADLGKVSFEYPKTWSSYEVSNGNDGDGYAVYFHPNQVPQVTENQQYALRMTVLPFSYNSVVESYAEQVKEGLIKSSPITVNNFTGVRITGQLSETRKGTLVLFKVRDKTLRLETDTDTFLDKFDGIVLKTLDFNP